MRFKHILIIFSFLFILSNVAGGYNFQFPPVDKSNFKFSCADTGFSFYNGSDFECNNLPISSLKYTNLAFNGYIPTYYFYDQSDDNYLNVLRGSFSYNIYKVQGKTSPIPYWTKETYENLNVSGNRFQDTSLIGDVCKIRDVQRLSGDNDFYVNSSLNKEFYDIFYNSSKYSIDEDVLKSHYYMKVFAYFQIGEKNGERVYFILPNEIEDNLYSYESKLNSLVAQNFKSDFNNANSFITEDGVKFYKNYSEYVKSKENINIFNPFVLTPYVLIKPGGDEISFNLDKIAEIIKDYPGEYDYKLVLIPVDGKCDFNLNTELKSEHEIKKKYKEFSAKTVLEEDIYSNEPIEMSFDETGVFNFKYKAQNDDGFAVEMKEEIGFFVKSEVNGKLVSNADFFKQVKMLRKYHKSINLSQTLDLVESGSVKTTNLNLELNQGSVNATLKINNLSSFDEKSVFLAYLPKTVNSSSVRIVPKNSNVKLKSFWVDRDPIIAWEFENGPDEVVIEGANDNITVVVTEQVEDLSENDELIVNYRPNCLVDEVSLFQTNNLIGGFVDKDFSSGYMYSVCLNSNYTLVKDEGRVLFRITDKSKGLIDSSGLEDVSLRVDFADKFVDTRIQKLNPGNYTCLGSFDSTGLFGDCFYSKENRIWIKIVEDKQGPQIDFNTLFYGHVVKFKISAQDLSGVDEVKYCVDESGVCVPNILYDVGLSPIIELACGASSDCQKFVRVNSSDLLGNFGVTQKIYSLIEEGNSCQQDCTIIPKPNRYIQDCQGVNLCNFYSQDVAKSCHFRVRDSWVDFNLTHKIKCPDGPIREKEFQPIFNSEIKADCQNVVKRSFPVTYNNERINLQFIFCAD